MKCEIDKIISGIGSPYGEGATYDTEEEVDLEISHLDKEDQERLRIDIQKVVNWSKDGTLWIEVIIVDPKTGNQHRHVFPENTTEPYYLKLLRTLDIVELPP